MTHHAVLLDFDGTASLTDVGGQLLDHFASNASWQVIDNDYVSGRVGSRAAYRLAEPLLRHEPEEWTAFALERARLDPGLGDLLTLCATRGWLLEVLSDGLDFYIHAVLHRAGLSLPVRANRVSADTTGRLRILTPHMNPLCGRCGTCKSARVAALQQSGVKVIYIGDGFSDLCAAPRADQVFAKGELARHCSKHRVEHSPFETLDQVTAALLDQQ